MRIEDAKEIENDTEYRDEVIDEDDEVGLPLPREVQIGAMADRVAQYSKNLWAVAADATAITALLHEAYELADLSYNADVAAQWGKEELPGGIPEDIVREHEDLLRANEGDFMKMAAGRLAEIHPSRMNHDRIARLSPDNPEIAKLQVLAEGMPVDTPEGFYPNGRISGGKPKLRKLYHRAHQAVDALLYKLVEARLAFVLTVQAALTIHGIHFSPAHWAVKPTKKSGRALIDSTDKTSRYPVLNSKEVAEQAAERWGRIQHPTIVQIIIMICEFMAAHPEASWKDLVLWKMDLRNAYHLLSFRADNCQLFAVELVGGLVIIFLCGLFGWSATPACFQVITRAIVFELTKRLSGVSIMYVDDIIGASLAWHATKDMDETTRICEDLLGPRSVAKDKTEFTNAMQRSLDAIGYTLDVALLVVTLTRRNFLRTIYAFFSVNETEPMPVATVERLASLATRYSDICRELRPFTRALYACTAGIKNRRASVRLTPAAQLTVHLWRTMLCLMAFEPQRFARPFASFVPTTPQYVIRFDASLQGVGVIIEENGAAGARAIVGASAVSLTRLNFGDEAKYQNTSEFIAVVIGLVALIRKVRRNRAMAIELHGDSITALKWAETARFRGSLVGNAASLFVMLLVRHNVQIASTVHVPGENNVQCDLLSRRDPEGRMRTIDEVVPGALDLRLDEDPVIQEIIRLCDPAVDHLSPGTFESFWAAAGALIEHL